MIEYSSWRKDEVGSDGDGDGLNASRRVPSLYAGAPSLLGLGLLKTSEILNYGII